MLFSELRLWEVGGVTGGQNGLVLGMGGNGRIMPRKGVGSVYPDPLPGEYLVVRVHTDLHQLCR